MVKRIVTLMILLYSTAHCNWETDENLSKRGTVEYYKTFAWIPTQCWKNKTYWLQEISMRRGYEAAGWGPGTWTYDVCIEGRDAGTK